ncbi:hypothetical protein ATANTOWER_027093 [Ataeniobius toweri]|uniref:Uncharacterized protein n=1 Tax=Ataeniobius toweri TaxID=208326 RepID=A0ABU7BRQ6_9TELE|nr:hypothetical protein [Ataeniobius toweri]
MFLDDQDYLCLVDFVWISFPSTKMAASCYPPSSEPSQKRTLSTFQRKYLNIELTPELTGTHSTAQVNHLDFLRFTHLGPDSLYPWRPDFTHLVSCSTINIITSRLFLKIIVLVFTSSPSPLSMDLAILPFTFQYHIVNKTPFTNSVV